MSTASETLDGQQIEAKLQGEIFGLWEDPLKFVQYAFPWGVPGTELEGETGPDDWQRQELENLGRLIKDRGFDGHSAVNPIRVALASGNGVGKTAFFAWVHWFLMSTRVNAKGRVTANTYTQLEITTWAEIQRWHKLLICRHWFEVTGSKSYAVANPEGWWSKPITCDETNSEAFAGQHNKQSTSFFLFDESSLIPDTIWDVADAGMTDGEPFHLAAGNPTRNTGRLYEVCFGSHAHRWHHRSIDARKCRLPNKALHDSWIQDYGLDSDYCRVHILGLPPRQNEEQFIGRDLVEGAQARTGHYLDSDPLIAGCDVADGGSAWFVVRFRRGFDTRPGAHIPQPIRVAGSKIDRDAMVIILADVLRNPNKAHRPQALFVDAAFGAAIAERLRSDPKYRFENVEEVRFGGKSPDQEHANKRAWMWGAAKAWLAKGAIDRADKKLGDDLMGPGYRRRLGGDGGIVLESKEEMARRGVASPDDGDAFVLTFAAPVAPVTPEQPAEEEEFGHVLPSRGGVGGWMGR
jgi:hypothetical protein